MYDPKEPKYYKLSFNSGPLSVRMKLKADTGGNRTQVHSNRSLPNHFLNVNLMKKFLKNYKCGVLAAIIFNSLIKLSGYFVNQLETFFIPKLRHLIPKYSLLSKSFKNLLLPLKIDQKSHNKNFRSIYFALSLIICQIE